MSLRSSIFRNKRIELIFNSEFSYFFIFDPVGLLGTKTPVVTYPRKNQKRFLKAVAISILQCVIPENPA